MVMPTARTNPTKSRATRPQKHQLRVPLNFGDVQTRIVSSTPGNAMETPIVPMGLMRKTVVYIYIVYFILFFI